MQHTLTITSKGQVTLRKDVLKHLNVRPGDKIAVELLPSGHVEVSAVMATTSIESFIGCLESTGINPPTIEEMNEIISEGWAASR